MNDAVSASEKSTSTTPESKRRCTGQPALAKTVSMPRLSPSVWAVKRSIPFDLATAARCSSSSVAMPLPWWRIVDHERHLGVVTVVPALVAGPRHELAPLLDDERRAIDEVDGRESFELGLRELWLGREVAQVAALCRLAQVERGQRVGVIRS